MACATPALGRGRVELANHANGPCMPANPTPPLHEPTAPRPEAGVLFALVGIITNKIGFPDAFALVGVITNKIGFPGAYSLPKGRRASSRHKHHRFVGDNTNKGGRHEGF